REVARTDEPVRRPAQGHEWLLQLHGARGRRGSLPVQGRRRVVPPVLGAHHLGGPALMAAKKKAAPKRKKAKPYVPKVTPELRARARKILGRLEKAYPDWGPTLEFTSPLELLVA